MPLSKIEFSSGIIKDDSALTAEGGFTDADKVRFKQGKPETMGGWSKLIPDQFTGSARAAKAWVDLNGTQHLAFATTDHLYALTGNTLTDITPVFGSQQTVSSITDISAQGLIPRPSVAGGSAAGSGPGTLDYPGARVVFSVTGSDGTTGANGSFNMPGLWPAGSITYVLNNSANALHVNDLGANPFLTLASGQICQFTANPAVPSGTSRTVGNSGYLTTLIGTAPAIKVVSGSNVVTMYHPNHGLFAGQSFTLPNTADLGGLTFSGSHTVATVIDANTWTWVASSNASYNANALRFSIAASWATGTTPPLPVVWSLDNFGEVLLANRRGGPLYAWQPAPAYPEVIVAGDMSDSTKWAQGTGWSISGGVATKTPTSSGAVGSYLSQTIRTSVVQGYTYRLTFTVALTSGTLTPQINAGNPAAVINVGDASTPIFVSGTYSLPIAMPADTVDLVFYWDALFNGTVDLVSLKLESNAFYIAEAPNRIDSMFIDPNRIVVALGTVEVNGDYNSMSVRSTGQDNFRDWVPTASNLANDFPLSKGGRIVGGVATRSQNLILTDEALYSMTFTGDTNAFSFKLMGTGCGLAGKNAVAEYNGVVFWLGRDGNFYIFQGAVPQVIECRIRRDVTGNLSSALQELVFAWVNSAFSEVWWSYPDTRDGLNECSRYAAYNWIEQHWTCGSFNRSAWAPPGIFASPIGFGTDGYVYLHEYGNTADGNSLVSYLELGYFDIEDGDHMMVVKAIVPDIANQIGNLQWTVGTKSFPNSVSSSRGPFVSTPRDQELNIRILGRQIKLRMDANANPSFWRLGALRIDAEKSGARR